MSSATNEPLGAALDDLTPGAAAVWVGVLQPVTELAIEIAREGREGRRVGTLFRETVKELAQLDGGFIVSAGGVVVSACRYFTEHNLAIVSERGPDLHLPANTTGTEWTRNVDPSET